MRLDDTIHLHRCLYYDDLHIERLVSRQPPTSLDLNTGVLHQEPGAATGMPMSARLLKYVSHPEGYGSDFPWSKALWRLKLHCRKEHPYHRAADRPYWRGSLCWQLVTFTVCRNWSVQNAAEILRYDNPEPVIRQALEFMEQHIDKARARQERKAQEDRGLFLLCRCGHDWHHHDRPAERFSCGACSCRRYEAEKQTVEHDPMSEAHVAECPNPVCRARRAA